MNKKNIPINDATKIKDEVVKEVVSINNGKPGDAQLRPNMAIIVIGDDVHCQKNVKKIEKEGKRVGVDIHSYICPVNSDEEEVEAMIECLNEDELIDGIYLCKILPPEFSYENILSLISTEKELNSDVDHIDDDDLRIAKLFKLCVDTMNTKDIQTI